MNNPNPVVSTVNPIVVDSTVQPAPVKASPPRFLDRAGVNLAGAVLVIMVITIAFSFSIMTWGFTQTDAVTEAQRYLSSCLTTTSSACPADRVALAQQLSTLTPAVENFRTFWRGVLELVLINVLLPVLTALLGYVFGTGAQKPTTN